MYNEFNVGMMENSMQFAGWMISALDEVGTKFAWYAHYDKALKTMVDADAVRYADDMARKAVAGRGIGEVPIMQKGKVFQTIAPFQLEVANTLFVLGDLAADVGKAEGGVAKSKQLSRYVSFIVATYLLNESVEKITGREVTMNPGQVLFDSYEIALSEKTAWEKTKGITGRAVGEAVTGVPLAPYVASGILKEEEQEILGMTVPSSGEFFGEDADPVKYGAPQPLLWRALNVSEWDSALDPFTSFVTPWGGAQLKKTIKGAEALSEGGVYDKDGNKMMDVKPGAVGALQNILFGHWNPNVAYKDQIEDEITSVVKQNNELVATGLEHNYDLARQNYEELSPEMKTVYKEMSGRVNMEEKVRQQNAMRPTLKIIDTLVEQERYDDARSITAAMTEDEKQSIIALKSRLDKENKEEFVPEDWEEDTLIQTVLDYSYAFMVSPSQTFEIMFKNNEVIEDSIGGLGGVVRTRRMPWKDYDRFEGSDSVKNELMREQGISDSSSVSLEHKLPLGMGGSNLRSNLELVPRDQHDAWTPVENDLIDAIKAKKLTWREAQIYMLRHKGYEGKPISHAEITEIINNK